MKDEEKTKGQLINEIKKMQEKIDGLEEIKFKYN